MTASPRRVFGDLEPHSREEFQYALQHLCAPFVDADDFTRQLDAISHPSAVYAPRIARLEQVSRLLWGLAPLAAGGGTYPGWAQIRQEIIAGTDPDDPGFWGLPEPLDQRIVESAALGFTLALAPGEIWEPLTPTQRSRLATWLRTATEKEPHDNNWRLFATLVNLGLTAVGENTHTAVTPAAFARIDEFYRGDGWYSDGENGAFDHYGPWAIHFYGLINAALDAVPEERAATVRDRARLMAHEYVHWFAADGAALPLGRSLTYRFAQAAFFGALAFADEPALPWGVLRGAWARNLRWWGRQPALNGDGTLSIGYGYPSLLMSETYNAPGSPYWAFKAFLPLALAPDHPFWTSAEQPLPDLPDLHAQPAAGLLIQRDQNGHVTALSATPGGRWARHGEAKYGKFAYSTAFGFAVPTRAIDIAGAAVDSMLALSEDGTHWRVREENETWSLGESTPHVDARWQPWPDVQIETWLIPAGKWQLRAHHITTGRALHTAEGGFCVPLDEKLTHHETNGPSALAATGRLSTALRDLNGTRRGEVIRPDPNGHLLWPRTLLPTLRGELEPGEHWLATAVFADTDADTAQCTAEFTAHTSSDHLQLLPADIRKMIAEPS